MRRRADPEAICHWIMPPDCGTFIVRSTGDATAMKARNPSGAMPPTTGKPLPARVTTIISCPGVVPLAPLGSTVQGNANENTWFDRIGFRRRWRANIAAIAVTLALTFAGVWVVQEFVRLQKLATCYEAGRRNCTALNLDRRGP